MLAYFSRLFSYDNWANREVLDSFRAAKNSPARAMKLLAHVLSAERLWLERLQQQKQTYPVWPDFALRQCESEAQELSGLWKNYLAKSSPETLITLVSYRNSKGESWTNSVEDILMHVVMHSAYHRGQIASDMRAAGYTPAYTDFIHGVRQRLVE